MSNDLVIKNGTVNSLGWRGLTRTTTEPPSIAATSATVFTSDRT